MNDEAEFVLAILAQPHEETLRLVYADWLQERNDPRAEFLRQESELTLVRQERDSISQELALQGLDKVGIDHLKRSYSLEEIEDALREHLTQYRSVISPLWLRWVDRTRVETCHILFDYLCPKQWGQLTLTADVRIRHCSQCNRGVHFCESPNEVEGHSRQGHRIAIASTLAPAGKENVTLGITEEEKRMNKPPPRERLIQRELPLPLVEQIRREAPFYSQPGVTELPIEQRPEIRRDRATQSKAEIRSAIRRWLGW